ncbi:MAG: ABC transporter ATP-binding protein [Brevundimonas sp.]|uniref:ABC transporter ATP-binding protein n=1 Tax=Brevundimonas sp. TaxID=1871086 RepID=UPI0025BE937A|nr:ABC transporter ATP-binding protein [Brevundimonas sp.]MBX3477655.1 ABC transporter ATP-binding protein [Brevundimonas sp.]
MSAAIETQGLTRRFGAVTAVDAVSMTVPRQAVYGFLGRNGAGKTTSLKMLLGLLRPSAGRALIDGVDVAADRIGAARRVGALLEAHGFQGHLTGRENLDLTRRLLGLARSEIDRVLAVVEMTADANRRVGGYSLGMRQRLGLARAMLGAPPVLILDEPTNGLDPDGIADMRRFLRSLPDRTGATVLLSSHLLGEIEQTASHVGVIHQGRLVLEGELAALRAGVAGRIALRTTDPARALALIRARGLEAEVMEEDIEVRLKPGVAMDAASATLNRSLVEAGIEVTAIGPRARTLEGLYRQATAVEPVAEAA